MVETVETDYFTLFSRLVISYCLRVKIQYHGSAGSLRLGIRILLTKLRSDGERRRTVNCHMNFHEDSCSSLYLFIY